MVTGEPQQNGGYNHRGREGLKLIRDGLVNLRNAASKSIARQTAKTGSRKAREARGGRADLCCQERRFAARDPFAAVFGGYPGSEPEDRQNQSYKT